MRFCVRYNKRTYSYYVLDNNDGAVVSARLNYDKAMSLAEYLNREDGQDGTRY